MNANPLLKSIDKLYYLRQRVIRDIDDNIRIMVIFSLFIAMPTVLITFSPTSVTGADFVINNPLFYFLMTMIIIGLIVFVFTMYEQYKLCQLKKLIDVKAVL